MACTFCKIIEGSIKSNIIYEDDLIMCFLDIEPINEGHVLIVPKEHYLDSDEIPDKILLAIMSLSKEMVKVIKEKYSPQGYSIMQNGGLFNDVGHYHMHVFPRYKNDGFGWTFSDTEFNITGDIAKELSRLLNQIKPDKKWKMKWFLYVICAKV